MAQSTIDLAKLFGAVATNLVASKAELNQADTQNNNHGDNITKAFKIITQAVKASGSAPVSTQLSNASTALLQQATSGSGQYYAQGLAQAAGALQGQQVLTPDTMMTLVTSLLGGGATPAAQAAPEQPADILGGLLGGLLGGGTGASGGTKPQALDLGDLLNAGLGYMQAKGRGEDDLQAIVDGVIAASPLATDPARARSAQIVAGTILQQVRKIVPAVN